MIMIFKILLKKIADYFRIHYTTVRKGLKYEMSLSEVFTRDDNESLPFKGRVRVGMG